LKFFVLFCSWMRWRTRDFPLQERLLSVESLRRTLVNSPLVHSPGGLGLDMSLDVHSIHRKVWTIVSTHALEHAGCMRAKLPRGYVENSLVPDLEPLR